MVGGIRSRSFTVPNPTQGRDSVSGEHGRRGEQVIILRESDILAIIGAEMGRLFVRLKRLGRDDALASQSGNLGLGLYIAEQIATAHGGSMQARSSNEEGTTFTVRLPRRPHD